MFTPTPGELHAADHRRDLTLAVQAQEMDGCALVVPGARRLPTMPLNNTLVALPRIWGPETMKPTDVAPSTRPARV